MASIRSGIGENMDRYLYRAKRLDNGEWVTGSLLTCEDGTCKIATSLLEVKTNGPILVCAYDVDRDTVCQCTGLKDRNGKLIWENDIIKTFDAGEECCLSKIIFADTSLGYGWKTTDIKSLSKYNNNLFKEVSFGSFDSKSAEIVGNIFDNAELLKSEE